MGFDRMASGTAAKVRDPALGQSWRYAKHDLITRAIVDTEVEQVSAIGRTIELALNSEQAKGRAPRHPLWAADWLQKYLVRDEAPAGPLPSEIQLPWGMVLIDSHWSEVQVYREPIPLWPGELRPGWSKTVNTLYKTPTSNDELPWQLTMTAHGWENLTVPAGQFKVLRYSNLINLRYANVSGKVAGRRMETVWLAPEVGRWVARESSGTFYQDVGEEFNEPGYRWELLGWS